jgi:LPS sulfotransferase NodH
MLKSNKVPIRAMVLSTQRSGSTFLVECLDSHPAIRCAGEILNGQTDEGLPAPRGRTKYLVKAARIARRGAWLPHYRLERFYGVADARVRCFKAMYNQLRRPLVLRYLLDHREIRVIHLVRHNLLKVYVSNLLMQKRRVLQATGPEPTVWIRVDPEKAIAAMRSATARYRHFETLFARHARLPLTYEGLFDGSRLQAATCREICDFLGVERRPMQSGIVKLNPNSLRDMVTNYDELADTVEHSEFASMLAA